MPRCSIIVPVYNRASLTRQCLNALLTRPPERDDCEIIVVDDASTDQTDQLLVGYGDRIRVVTHAANTGFAAACNDGAALASGEYLLFLNNDTFPTRGWLDTLLDYADLHPEAAVVGCKLLYLDDTVQHVGLVIGQDRNPYHIYVGFPADHPAVSKSRRFQIVTGACMLVQRRAWDQVGGFDTDYQNSYEDVELCLSLGELGYEVHFCHESVLYHLESATRGDSPQEEMRNLQRYRCRWADRVQPDEVQYYLEDGLLQVDHGTSSVYPVVLTVSPLLAVVSGDEDYARLGRLLRARAILTNELLKENIRLKLDSERADFGPLGASGDDWELTS